MPHRVSPKTGLVIILVGLLAACSSQSATAPTATPAGASAAPAGEPIKIGLITKTETNPFFVKMKEGAEMAAKENNAILLAATGRFDHDTESQIAAIENMVGAGVKGILITPSDSKALVPAVKKARDAGVLVIALDTPLDPLEASDALFATDNYKAGLLIGQYAKAAMGNKQPKIATLDVSSSISVGVLRHNGFIAGYGLALAKSSTRDYVNPKEVVCSGDSEGDQAKGQTAMENCLRKASDINLVYTINEPAAFGAYSALKAVGKEKDVLIVSVDGGCRGVQGVKDGKIGATSQQYPLQMAVKGVEAVVRYAKDGTKVSGYADTGVILITDKAVADVDSKNTAFGLGTCWGSK